MTNQFSAEQNWVVDSGLWAAARQMAKMVLGVEWALTSPALCLAASGSPCCPFRGAELGSEVLPRHQSPLSPRVCLPGTSLLSADCKLPLQPQLRSFGGKSKCLQRNPGVKPEICHFV